MTYKFNDIRARGANSSYSASFDEVKTEGRGGDTFRAVGILKKNWDFAGVKHHMERAFDVKISDDGRFYITIGSSGYKIVFHVPGWR